MDHAKQTAIDAFKAASTRAIQKTAKVTGDLIENKIDDKITKASKTLPQNNSLTNEKQHIGLDRDIHRERYISSRQRQRMIDDLRLI